MKLYAIASQGLNGPEPLYDSETGAPAVFVGKEEMLKELGFINRETQGGYHYVEFETEDQ